MPIALRYRLRELMAAKELKTGERLSYSAISDATDISRNTLSKMGLQQLERIPAFAIVALCQYFDCQPGDLFVLQEVSDGEDG